MESDRNPQVNQKYNNLAYNKSDINRKGERLITNKRYCYNWDLEKKVGFLSHTFDVNKPRTNQMFG